MTTEKLSLLVTANTLRATTSLNALEGKLRKLSASGGVSGLFGRVGAGGVHGLKMGVSGLGSTLGFVTRSFGTLGSVGSRAIGLVLSPVKLLTRAVGWGLKTAVGLGKAALLGLGAGAATAGAAIWAGIRALGPAGQKESAGISWEVMLKSQRKAQERMGFLSRFNAATPFDFTELDAGARLMETYGIYSERNLRAVGDAVSAFGKRIEEAVGPLAKLKTGLWETESLATIGLTRDVMRGQGIKFDATGGLQSSGAEAFDAAIRYFEKRFGGMMARVSTSWNGLKSTFASVWFELAAAMGDKFLKPAKGALGEMIGLVTDLTEKVNRIEVPWADKIHVGARMLRDLVNDMTTAEGRARVLAQLKASASAVPGFVGGLAKAASADIGKAFEWLVTNWRAVSAWFMDGLKLSFRFGASLFGEVLGGFSTRFRDQMTMIAERALLPKNRTVTNEYWGQMNKAQYAALGKTVGRATNMGLLLPLSKVGRDEGGNVTLGSYLKSLERERPEGWDRQAWRIRNRGGRLAEETGIAMEAARAQVHQDRGWSTGTTAALGSAGFESKTFGQFIARGAAIGGSLLGSMTNVMDFLKSPEGLKAITAPVVNQFRARAVTAREAIEEPERAAKRAADLAWFEKRASRVMVSGEGRNALANAGPAAGYFKMAWRNLGSPQRGGEDTARAVLDRAWTLMEEQNRVWNESRLKAEEAGPSGGKADAQLDEQRQTKAAIHEVSAKIDRLADAQAQLALALVG
jgi:hypothetical protein